MTDPQDAARSRTSAIQVLEDALKQHVEEAQKLLWEGLLARLKDIYADPALLPTLLQEYANRVLAPLAMFYGHTLLQLPALSVNYFAALSVAGYERLRMLLSAFLRNWLGIEASGALTPGRYLAQVAGDTTVARRVVTYAYQSFAINLDDYREGLQALVLGSQTGAGRTAGVVEHLYQHTGDELSRTDRLLQQVSANELGLTAAIYQGGIVARTRHFCSIRNERVFINAEIARFGTASDPYGGYTNKADGLFSGKTDPYNPFTDCGGHNCRHHWHYIPNLVALRLRADLAENDRGELFIK